MSPEQRAAFGTTLATMNRLIDNMREYRRVFNVHDRHAETQERELMKTTLHLLGDKTRRARHKE
jgi:hypothetical protein